MGRVAHNESFFDLINNEQGEFYNIFAERVNLHLRKKAVEICKAGANVILDWGFWTRDNRIEITEYLKSFGIMYEWHYMDVDDDSWEKNIEERNRRIQEGNGGSDFFVDEGLKNKVLTLFEVPSEDEIDVWYKLER